MLLLIHPGTKSEIVSLQSVLKERHENLRAFTDKEIARRTARGIPLDGLTPLDDYADVDGYDDVRVRFLALSEEERGIINATVEVAQATRAALADKPVVEVAAEAAKADSGVVKAMIDYVRKVVVEVDLGDGKLDLTSDAVCAALAATGQLLTHLFVAAREYQGLSAGKKERRFGLPQQST